MPDSGFLDRGHSWVWIGVVTALGIAYRELWVKGIDAFRLHPVSSLVFAPGQDTLLVGLGVALWIVWRDRFELFGPPEAANGYGSDIGARVGCGLAAALLVWSRIVRAPELLLVSAAALLIGFAFLRRGRQGAREAILPVIVLLIAIPIPPALESTWVWAMQTATATITSAWLHAFGVETMLEGIQIRWPGYRFEVSENWCGLRLIQILVPVALGFGHRFGLKGDRLALFAVFGACLGFVLSLLRLLFALLAADDTRGVFVNETNQAIGLSLVGIVGLALAARRFGKTASIAAKPNTPSKHASETLRSERRLLTAPAALLTLSLVVHSPFDARSERPGEIVFPQQAHGWKGTDLARDYTFPYTTSRARWKSRVFAPDAAMHQAPGGVVESFIAYESRRSLRIPSRKLPLPSADWHIVNEFPGRRNPSGERLRVTELTRNNGSEFALVYSWRRRDAGLFIESLRALSGLDAVDWTPDRPRVAIRAATALASQLRSDRRRAIRLLDRFVGDFRADFDSL